MREREAEREREKRSERERSGKRERKKCEREAHTYFKRLVEDRVQSLPLHPSLSLGALAAIGEEVGLDVGIRESVAVGSCQISGPVHVDVQLL